jgi:biotin-(acetyl-CoA carboxylase) ligase
MKTIEIQLFKFDELSDKAKEKALTQYYDWNVNFDWWDSVYYDAKNVGITINGFDIDRGNYCKIEFRYDEKDICQKIIMEHGENCETHKIATKFLSDYDELVKRYSDGIIKDIVSEYNEEDFDNEIIELETELHHELSEEYLSILRKEYEYLTSEEAIIEALEANEIEFTINGEIYN